MNQSRGALITLLTLVSGKEKELTVYMRVFSVSVRTRGGFRVSELAGCSVDEGAWSRRERAERGAV